MKSFDLIYILGIYFPEIRFVSTDSSSDCFEMIEECVQADSLNIKKLLTKPIFKNLVPKKFKQLDEQEQDAILKNIEEQANDGFIKYFIKLDDENFIKELNRCYPPSSGTIDKSEFFSIPDTFAPEDFFIGYDYEQNIFSWDFSPIVLGDNYIPREPYSAFKRYAHGQYTKIAIGTYENSTMTDMRQLLQRGTNLLLNSLQQRDATDWLLVERATQEGTEETLYTPRSLDDVMTSLRFYLSKGLSSMTDSKYFDFDRGDIQNVNNAIKEVASYLTYSEKYKLESSSFQEKIRFLYNAIFKPEIGCHISSRRKSTIQGLYNKILLKQTFSSDVPVNDDSKPFSIDTYEDTRSQTPEMELINQEMKTSIKKLFEKHFPGEPLFSEVIHNYIDNETLSHILAEIVKYQSNSHNANSLLFRMYCETYSFNWEDKHIKKGHTLFSAKIKKIISDLIKGEIEI